MTAADTPEKIPAVGSVPSEKDVPPQTHHCGGIAVGVDLQMVTCAEMLSHANLAEPRLRGGSTLDFGTDVQAALYHLPEPQPISLTEAMRQAEERRDSNLTATMINQAIGLVLHTLGRTEITISTEQIMDFAKHNRVLLRQERLDGNYTISVTPRVPE